VCGASKDALKKIEQEIRVQPVLDSSLPKNLSFGQLSALFGNLAKGCEKQGKPNEQALFKTLEDHYKSMLQKEQEDKFSKLDCLLGEDLEKNFSSAFKEAKTFVDRGAQRALAWCEQVSYKMRSLLNKKTELLAMIGAGNSVHVCQICGFIGIADEAPDKCPVCGVPKFKIKAV
jgi:rubrerythrin